MQTKKFTVVYNFMSKFTKGCLLKLFSGNFEILKILHIIYAAYVNLHRRVLTVIYTRFLEKWGTAVAQWLRCFATNRTVAGSIPDGVIGIFH